MQAGGIDAARRPGALTRGAVHGGGRRWRGQERQEETPSDSRLGAREGGGTDDQKRNPTQSRLKRGVGVGGTRQGGVGGINKVSCKFHVTLFGCRVGGDVGQLSSPCPHVRTLSRHPTAHQRDPATVHRPCCSLRPQGDHTHWDCRRQHPWLHDFLAPIPPLPHSHRRAHPLHSDGDGNVKLLIINEYSFLSEIVRSWTNACMLPSLSTQPFGEMNIVLCGCPACSGLRFAHICLPRRHCTSHGSLLPLSHHR